MFKQGFTIVVLALAAGACSQKEQAAPNSTQGSAATATQNPAPSTSPQAPAASTESAPGKASQRSAASTPAAPKQKSLQQAANDSARRNAQQSQQAGNDAATDGSAPPEPATKPKKKIAKKTEEAVSGGAAKASSDTADRWSEFQAMVSRCETLTGAKRNQCLDEADGAYRVAGLQCEKLPDADRKECLKYGERSNNPGPKQAITHTDTPTITTADPGDPTPAERNRDSTIQQQDAAGALPESSRKD